ncbi:MAG: CoF synthetase [Planctomycetia bacterium 21-64-5]|nr:MAG: CoF synthetase [Planctomycetia bacterium 21-64-5]HQU44279.1 AMP-binding protein [Pirellulales bacterium]
MTRTLPAERRRLESLDRRSLEKHQLARLNALFERIAPINGFYRTALQGLTLPLASLAALTDFRYTTKDDLLGDGELAANRTWPIERYVRFHQTSGTRGRPLAVLDTADDWTWWTGCWQYVLDAADVTPDDCVMMAFSFGPFVGFWSAYEAAAARGCLVVPGGGMTSAARLELIRTSRATVVCCTPGYALHLAEVGRQRQLDVGTLGVRVLILAGEPGGSVPATRERIERAWRAEVLDHAGATEIGPWGYGDRDGRGLHVMESEFIAEFRSLASGEPAQEGELSELVLTTLGRAGSPVVRYRTGDLVRPVWRHDLKNRFVLLEGGIVGRSDDMLTVRGVNVFPSSVEQIVRGFPEVDEFRLVAYRIDEMDQLAIEVEDRLEQPGRIADEVYVRLGLRVDVRCVPPGRLPRSEGKAIRLIDQRRPTDPRTTR